MVLSARLAALLERGPLAILGCVPHAWLCSSSLVLSATLAALVIIGPLPQFWLRSPSPVLSYRMATLVMYDTLSACGWTLLA